MPAARLFLPLWTVTLWNHKSKKSTLSSISCLGHGVLSQQQRSNNTNTSHSFDSAIGCAHLSMLLLTHARHACLSSPDISGFLFRRFKNPIIRIKSPVNPGGSNAAKDYLQTLWSLRAFREVCGVGCVFISSPKVTCLSLCRPSHWPVKGLVDLLTPRHKPKTLEQSVQVCLSYPF